MALADWLGLGGQPEMFTEWNSARNFVIYTVIVGNPRISESEKIELQKFEERAYQENTGKWFLSEREEIARYFNYLKNNVKPYTKDKGILEVFEIADATASDVADPNKAAGLEINTKKAGATLATLAIVGLGLFYVFSKK